MHIKQIDNLEYRLKLIVSKHLHEITTKRLFKLESGKNHLEDDRCSINRIHTS